MSNPHKTPESGGENMCPTPETLIQHWGVTVSVNGNDILTIESNCLSGVHDIHRYEDTIRQAAQNLLGFIGGGSSFLPDDAETPLSPPPAETSGGEPVALKKSLEFVVMFLAFTRRDYGTERFEKTLAGLWETAAELDPIIRAALSSNPTVTEDYAGLIERDLLEAALFEANKLGSISMAQVKVIARVLAAQALRTLQQKNKELEEQAEWHRKAALNVADALTASQAEAERLSERVTELEGDNQWLRDNLKRANETSDRLRRALMRIDAINDNPSRFNPEINEVIIEAALSKKPAAEEVRTWDR